MLKTMEGVLAARRAGSRIAACALALLVLASPAGRARADAADVEAPPPAPPPRHAVFGELAYYGTDDSASSLSLVRLLLGGRYAYDARWSFSLRAGLVALDSSPDLGPGDFTLRLGNPELLAWYDALDADGTAGRGAKRALRVRFGLGGSGPLASIERGADARLHRTALNYAMAVDGLGTVWLWAPSRSAAVAAAIAQWDAHADLMLEAELWPALLIPSREEFWKEPVDLYVPLTVGARTRGSSVVSLGLYGRAVWMPTADVDSMQLSVEPRVRLTLASVFAEARVTVNVDEPLSGRRGTGPWGAHLSAGGSL